MVIVSIGKITYDKNEYSFYIDTKFNVYEDQRKLYVSPLNGVITYSLNKSELEIKDQGKGGAV